MIFACNSDNYILMTFFFTKFGTFGLYGIQLQKQIWPLLAPSSVQLTYERR